ncbi:phospholipase D family protein [Bradyrhizobium elkanii]|uniref:phospholipase D family protein n=1 Tax=Bradyrhizobium elkanii TaxID=29448 RepID=UPI001AE0FD20|nr:phospholipase D family protein [Bradyrhizobium elkanii]MBP2428852.1 hypothetical protein [Bradyrhizobium elkanii]WLA93599.1 phospholipase D family protein [Bradyrhizobium elkanii]
MTERPAWPSQAYLDALRPGEGSEVTGAILTSYSADLPSIVAALLALSGSDNDAGSGSKTDLAEAVEQLRGKVRILIQRGRLARLKRMPPIAAILDQFIREIDFDERQQSWHPKIALVRLTNGEMQNWRMWFGSRNLTRAINRDFGVLLTSAPDLKAAGASAVPGIGEVAERLASLAGLERFVPARARAALANMRWSQPAPFRVERLDLTDGKGSNALPQIKDADQVMAISPFLDGDIVGKIGAWGGPRTSRQLLSTRIELAKLAAQSHNPLAGFAGRLFALEAPEPDTIDAEPRILQDSTDTADVEDEQLTFGLHAKILAVRKGRQLRLWVGSANATQRAWEGRNVEVIAELSASIGARAGLDELFAQARAHSLAELRAINVLPEGGDEDRLEEARKAVVARWRGRLTREANAFSVHADTPPHPDDPGIQLEVGLATGAFLPWPRGQTRLEIGEYPAQLQTQLLQFRLTLGELECSWLQCVEVTPPLDGDRDRHAIAHHLGMSAFLAWIAALLTGERSGEGGDPWNAPPQPGSEPHNQSLIGSLLTLDAMLACWARDPTVFRTVARRVESYLAPVMAHATAVPEDLKRLTAFQSVWAIVSNELLKDH